MRISQQFGFSDTSELDDSSIDTHSHADSSSPSPLAMQFPPGEPRSSTAASVRSQSHPATPSVSFDSDLAVHPTDYTSPDREPVVRADLFSFPSSASHTASSPASEASFYTSSGSVHSLHSASTGALSPGSAVDRDFLNPDRDPEWPNLPPTRISAAFPRGPIASSSLRSDKRGGPVNELASVPFVKPADLQVSPISSSIESNSSPFAARYGSDSMTASRGASSSVPHGTDYSGLPPLAPPPPLSSPLYGHFAYPSAFVSSSFGYVAVPFNQMHHVQAPHPFLHSSDQPVPQGLVPHPVPVPMSASLGPYPSFDVQATHARMVPQPPFASAVPSAEYASSSVYNSSYIQTQLASSMGGPHASRLSSDPLSTPRASRYTSNSNTSDQPASDAPEDPSLSTQDFTHSQYVFPAFPPGPRAMPTPLMNPALYTAYRPMPHLPPLDPQADQWQMQQQTDPSFSFLISSPTHSQGYNSVPSSGPTTPIAAARPVVSTDLLDVNYGSGAAGRPSPATSPSSECGEFFSEMSIHHQRPSPQPMTRGLVSSSSSTAPLPVRALSTVEKKERASPDADNLSDPSNEWHPVTAIPFKSAIMCGHIDNAQQPDPSAQSYRMAHYSDFFGAFVPIYTALTDPQNRILYRARDLAAHMGCDVSTLCMFLKRINNKGEAGVFQATSIQGKHNNNPGLKRGAYFVTKEVCDRFVRRGRQRRLAPMSSTLDRDAKKL